MFRFFTVRKWFLWAWAGSFAILSSLWVQVQIDVKINEWFGQFYDMIQKPWGNLMLSPLRNIGRAFLILYL